jgi:hypothetical protein
MVVLESADPVGVGGDLVRLAFGNRRVSRFELASLHWRRRRLAMVAGELRRVPQRPHLAGDSNDYSRNLSLVRLRVLVRSSATQNMAYRRLRDGMARRGRRFHPIVRSPPQRFGSGCDAGPAFRHAVRGHSRRLERAVSRGPGYWALLHPSQLSTIFF